MSIEIKNLRQNPTSNSKPTSTPVRSSQKNTSDSNTGVTNDAITLTNTASTLLAGLQTALQSTTIIDNEKVADIKNRIAENTFEINELRIADKFIKFESQNNS